MADSSSIVGISRYVTEPLTIDANKILGQAPSSTKDDAKIEKSAKDFESILLSNWLQQAEQSFGSLPGGDDEDDADSGKDQFQCMAMQSLGASLVASGGIGIAKMISQSLHKAEDARVDSSAKTHPDPP